MIAVAYRDPTISRFAIADGVLHIGGLPVGLLAADTDGAIGVDRRPVGLHDR
jgi:hypothetical protein